MKISTLVVPNFTNVPIPLEVFIELIFLVGCNVFRDFNEKLKLQVNYHDIEYICIRRLGLLRFGVECRIKGFYVAVKPEKFFSFFRFVTLASFYISNIRNIQEVTR